METIWKLYKACTLPMITYGSEAWIMNNQEKKQIQSINNLQFDKKTGFNSVAIELDVHSVKSRKPIVITNILLLNTLLIGDNIS